MPNRLELTVNRRSFKSAPTDPLAAIEAPGEVSAAPTAWLADAGLEYLQARILCLSAQEDEGVALDQSIIDFEPPAFAGKTN